MVPGSEAGAGPGLASYCSLRPSHTLCRYKSGQLASQCGAVTVRTVSPAVRTRLLNLHNQVTLSNIGLVVNSRDNTTLLL